MAEKSVAENRENFIQEMANKWISSAKLKEKVHDQIIKNEGGR